MSTPGYGELTYTIQEIWTAQLNTITEVYGTPAEIGYVQDGDLSPEHDNDSIKAKGMIRELLAIQTSLKIKFGEAWLNQAAVTAITNESETESGDSGERVSTRIRSGAGGGLPYVGLVLVFAASNGSFYVHGAPKCMAMKKPQFKAEQNKFRTGEMEFDVASANASVNKIDKQVRFERIDELPDFSDQAEFQAFFAEMFS